MGSFTIGSVPNPVLSSIFSFLDLGDIGRSAQVCKRWKALTEDEGLRSIFYERLRETVFQYPRDSWEKARQYYTDNITFSTGQPKCMFIHKWNMLYSLSYQSIRAAVKDDLIVFHNPTTSSFQLWNWKLACPLRQFKVDSGGVPTSLFDDQSYLVLDGDYLVYVRNNVIFSSHAYLWRTSSDSFFPCATIPIRGKKAQCQLSGTTLSVTCSKYPGENNGWKTALGFSMYNLSNIAQIKPNVTLEPFYHNHLKGDGVNFWNPIVRYKDTFVLVRNLDKITLFNRKTQDVEDLFPEESSRSPKASHVTAQLHGQSLCVYRWCSDLKHSYFDSIHVWDLEHKKHVTGLFPASNNIQDGVFHDPMRGVTIFKSLHEISIHNQEFKTLRNVQIPSIPTSCSSIHLSGNTVLILAGSEVCTIEFSTKPELS